MSFINQLSCRCDNTDNDHSHRRIQLRDVAPIGDDSHSIYCYCNSDKYVYNDIPTIETTIIYIIKQNDAFV